MAHPIGYYASALHGTSDAAILTKLEEQIGSFSENLSRTEQLTFLAVLAIYLLYKGISIEQYKINEAIFDVLPTPEANIGDAIQQVEGISESNATGLIAFFAAQLSANCFR